MSESEKLTCGLFGHPFGSETGEALAFVAPWPDWFVGIFKRRQATRHLHPLTCSCGGGNLDATTQGIVCPACGYSQSYLDIEHIGALYSVEKSEPTLRANQNNPSA